VRTPFVLAVRSTRKTAEVHGWPFCPQCRRWRFGVLGAALTGVGLGVAMFFLGMPRLETGNGSNPLDWLTMAGFVFGVAGMLVLILVGWQETARAAVSRDGTMILVRRPHERFAARAAELATVERDQNRSGSLFPHRSA
jgi:hypothetical protein